jgi:hypothetical protein
MSSIIQKSVGRLRCWKREIEGGKGQGQTEVSVSGSELLVSKEAVVVEHRQRVHNVKVGL